MSKVLFICSANLLETISPPLLDRMETIELSGYTSHEKKEIANNYLLPKNLEKCGLKDDYTIKFTDDALTGLIVNYAREAGVRSLDKYIRRVCEKICLKIVKAEENLYSEDNEIIVHQTKLRDFVGVPIFSSQRMYEQLAEGISIGLGYNSMGGSILYIETCKNSYPVSLENSDGKSDKDAGEVIDGEEKSGNTSKLTVTGSLGKVMQESIQIAHTYAKYVMHDGFGNEYLEMNDIHIHFPEGASKKDGPSAGITITTALISLALGKPIPNNFGMTGEISLNGKIMKIGGVREKILAAKREGLRQIIMPGGNKADVDELQGYVKEGVEFHFVNHYEDAMKILFPDVRKVMS